MINALASICVLQLILIVWILYRSEKERREYTKLIASKSYSEYKALDRPVKNTDHSTMIKKQQAK